MAEYNRYETPMARGAHWPDGSPVSNWSQAVALLVRRGALHGSGAQPAEHSSVEDRRETERSMFAGV
jgi:hypothetical protein